MRIGLISGEYPPMLGGVGAYTQILAQHLVDEHHEVFILSSTQAAESDARIHLSPVIVRWGLGSLSAMRQWAMDNRLEVVNLQYQTAAFAMSPWIHFIPDIMRRIPIITTFHDLRHPYLFPKAGRVRDWIVMRLAFRSAGAIVTNHEDMARLNRLHCKALIPIGSNILQPLDAFEPKVWRQRAGASEGDLLLSFFGLINRSKGLGVLLEALAALRNDGVPARLLIIGGSAGSSDPSNAEYQAEIQARIEQRELRPFVHSTGFVDEETVANYLTASDVVVLPFQDGASFRRGSLMAAIQYGCAVVTTQPTVSIPDFINGENMLLVERESSKAVADAVLHLWHETELRLKLQRGAQALSSRFQWPQIARETISCYERVIGAKA